MTTIKRYDVYTSAYGPDFEESPHGEWVKYEDHIAALAVVDPPQINKRRKVMTLLERALKLAPEAGLYLGIKITERKQ